MLAVDDKAGVECKTLGQQRVWSGSESAAHSADRVKFGCHEGGSGNGETENFGAAGVEQRMKEFSGCWK